MSAQEQNRKRKREEKGKATVGQLTSGIKNKQVRSEQYGKLRHKAKVCIFSLSTTPLVLDHEILRAASMTIASLSK